MTEDLQQDIFSGGKSVKEAQIDAAIDVLAEAGYYIAKGADKLKELLVEEGYKVLDPIKVIENIDNKPKLRDYFYMRLFKKYPERQTTVIKNFKRDLKLIGKFVESREVDLSRENAIQECIAIIDTIFDFEEEFGFTKPIEMGVLGQASASWVTEKALYILNANRIRRQEEIDDIMRQELEDAHGVDLEAKANRLEKILSKMEDKDGDSEKTEVEDD